MELKLGGSNSRACVHWQEGKNDGSNIKKKQKEINLTLTFQGMGKIGTVFENDFFFFFLEMEMFTYKVTRLYFCYD